METPSASDLVRVWELGRDQPSWFRGLLILAPAFPERSFNQLAQMTLGQRNICLWRLRERLFGADLTAVVHCPACGRPSEFAARIDEICPHQVPSWDAPALSDLRVAVEGESIGFRPPTSEDLAAVEEAAGTVTLSPALAERLIEPAAAVDAVGAERVIEAVIEATYACDPQIAMLLDLECAECGEAWSAPLDCVGFLWTEIGGLAQRLLDEVHLLASAYGWPEAHILAMSAVRRGFYVERTAR
jgi:hypothetical protein